MGLLCLSLPFLFVNCSEDDDPTLADGVALLNANKPNLTCEVLSYGTFAATINYSLYTGDDDKRIISSKSGLLLSKNRGATIDSTNAVINYHTSETEDLFSGLSGGFDYYDLQPNTTYYYRAFAYYKFEGMSDYILTYSEENQFTTKGYKIDYGDANKATAKYYVYNNKGCISINYDYNISNRAHITFYNFRGEERVEESYGYTWGTDVEEGKENEFYSGADNYLQDGLIRRPNTTLGFSWSGGCPIEINFEEKLTIVPSKLCLRLFFYNTSTVYGKVFWVDVEQ